MDTLGRGRVQATQLTKPCPTAIVALVGNARRRPAASGGQSPTADKHGTAAPLSLECQPDLGAGRPTGRVLVQPPQEPEVRGWTTGIRRPMLDRSSVRRVPADSAGQTRVFRSARRQLLTRQRDRVRDTLGPRDAGKIGQFEADAVELAHRESSPSFPGLYVRVSPGAGAAVASRRGVR